MITYDNGTSTAASPTPGSYLSDWTTLTNNTSSANSALGGKLINQHIRELATKFYFNERSFTVPGGTVAQQQAYVLPFNFEVIENVTVQVGGYLWQPKVVASRKMFDMLNLIPYYNDYPQYYYIWNNQLLLWPIPASNSNVMTVNYKKRVKDLSMADNTTGTVSITTATNTVTGVGTSFREWMEDSGWLRVTRTTTNASTGDGEWYQISAVASDTSLTLVNAYAGQTTAGAAITIGDVPILPEDYQDMPLYRALYIYYNSIVPDKNLALMYKSFYDDRYVELAAKYGSKDYSPVLTDMEAPVYNPNLFPRNLS